MKASAHESAPLFDGLTEDQLAAYEMLAQFKDPRGVLGRLKPGREVYETIRAVAAASAEARDPAADQHAPTHTVDANPESVPSQKADWRLEALAQRSPEELRQTCYYLKAREHQFRCERNYATARQYMADLQANPGVAAYWSKTEGHQVAEYWYTNGRRLIGEAVDRVLEFAPTNKGNTLLQWLNGDRSADVAERIARHRQDDKAWIRALRLGGIDLATIAYPDQEQEQAGSGNIAADHQGLIDNVPVDGSAKLATKGQTQSSGPTTTPGTENLTVMADHPAAQRRAARLAQEQPPVEAQKPILPSVTITSRDGSIGTNVMTLNELRTYDQQKAEQLAAQGLKDDERLMVWVYPPRPADFVRSLRKSDMRRSGINKDLILGPGRYTTSAAAKWAGTVISLNELRKSYMAGNADVQPFIGNLYRAS